MNGCVALGGVEMSGPTGGCARRVNVIQEATQSAWELSPIIDHGSNT